MTDSLCESASRTNCPRENDDSFSIINSSAEEEILAKKREREEKIARLEERHGNLEATGKTTEQQREQFSLAVRRYKTDQYEIRYDLIHCFNKEERKNLMESESQNLGEVTNLHMYLFFLKARIYEQRTITLKLKPVSCVKWKGQERTG